VQSIKLIGGTFLASNSHLEVKLKSEGGISMIRTIGNIAAGFALIFMLGGCQAMTGRTAGQNVDDSGTTAAVKARLAQAQVSSLTRIDVDTNGGVVALNGTVESASQRAQAEQIARAVNGVKRVINNLQVQR